MTHTYSVIIRSTEDVTIHLRASSPERALQLATNIAANAKGQPTDHEVVSWVSTRTPVPTSVKKVG
jgi:hypothetical protein